MKGIAELVEVIARRVSSVTRPSQSASRGIATARTIYIALRAAMQHVPQDATLDICELDGIPGFNQDEEQNPPAKVSEFKRRIRESDAILIVTPEYNYSIPGVLAGRIQELLARLPVKLDSAWGLDHGPWSVLRYV